jgi:hypothetical protein
MSHIDTTAETRATETTTENTAAHDDPRHTAGVQPDTDYVLADALGAFARVGLMWARHGVGMGRSALDASAATLRATSEVLRAVSERLEVPEAPESTNAPR